MDPLQSLFEWLTTVDIHCNIVIQFRNRRNVPSAGRGRTHRSGRPAPGAGRYTGARSGASPPLFAPFSPYREIFNPLFFDFPERHFRRGCRRVPCCCPDDVPDNMDGEFVPVAEPMFSPASTIQLDDD